MVIPIFNAEGRLERCLESLKVQTYPRDRFEVIVADGMSTDASVEIARRYGATVVDNPQRRAGAGRNTALEVARGDLIAFTEDDVELPPQWLASGQACLSSSGADAVGGPTPIPDSSGRFARAVYVFFDWASRLGYSVHAGQAGRGEVHDLPGCNVMYPADVLRQFLPIDSPRAEDVELHIRMKKQGRRLVQCPEFYAWHHKRQGPRQFYRQIARFARGRAWLLTRHREGMRPLHWIALLFAPILAASILFALALDVVDVETLLAGGLVALALPSLSAAVQRRSVLIGLCMALVLTLFPIAWTHGFLSERLRLRWRGGEPPGTAA